MLHCRYRQPDSGHGYGHLLENIRPELQRRGVSNAQLHTMLVENPARLLAVE